MLIKISKLVACVWMLVGLIKLVCVAVELFLIVYEIIYKISELLSDNIIGVIKYLGHIG